VPGEEGAKTSSPKYAIAWRSRPRAPRLSAIPTGRGLGRGTAGRGRRRTPRCAPPPERCSRSATPFNSDRRTMHTSTPRCAYSKGATTWISMSESTTRTAERPSRDPAPHRRCTVRGPLESTAPRIAGDSATWSTNDCSVCSLVCQRCTITQCAPDRWIGLACQLNEQ
jgi:hypothetical protein